MVRGKENGLLTTVLSAAVGGLLAGMFWTVPLWLRAAVVLAAVVISAAMAYFVLTAPPPRPQAQPPAPPPPEAAPARAWWTEQAPPASNGARPVAVPTHVAVPKHEAPQRIPARPAVSPEEPPPLIAQCPSCGGFRLDVGECRGGFAFRCRSPGCAARWEWAPQTPWPAVVVRRNLTAALTDAEQQREPT